jgi:valyl-tRNA synthetase
MEAISTAYEPGAVEQKWYEAWIRNNAFRARVPSAQPSYSIVIPPPNVTGVLTMGHVLNNPIQDILARRARMLGKNVLWLPGTDHAGIATQTVVERQLRKEGKTRFDLGREEFVKRVWQWKERHGGIIIESLRKARRAKRNRCKQVIKRTSGRQERRLCQCRNGTGRPPASP